MMTGTTTTAMTTEATEAAPSSAHAITLYPLVQFPHDPGLAELPNLFNPEWVWQTYVQQVGIEVADPERIRIRYFAHSLGRIAVIGYEVQWPRDAYLPAEYFGVRLERDRPIEFVLYPDDRFLPGLGAAAQPDSAIRLLSKHVLSLPPRRASVELVRYRPTSRALLRHSVGKVRFYARVVPPTAVAPILAAQELIARSSFVVPRLAGYWRDGGIVWLSEIPGRNLRERIRSGKAPDPSPLLDGLASIWSAPYAGNSSPSLNLPGAYRRAKQSFKHHVLDNGAARRHLIDASKSLDPFMASWRPSGIAHNDFYDDQLLELRDGRLALVDFEEAGPGDPMLDVGTFLAHLRWSAGFAGENEAVVCSAYHQVLREAALDRFRWDERDLNLREAVCLFRICTNTIRHPQPDWPDRLERGLSLVNEALG